MSDPDRVARTRPCPPLDLAAFETFVFDLDNTLYPAACNLFAQVDARIGRYVGEVLGLDPPAARTVQKAYFRRYGTTLCGLMAEHGVDAAHYLERVHDIDLSPVRPDPALRAALEKLPGRRLIFTNASRAHAERVTARLGVDDLFGDIFDIADGAFVPKPEPGPYDALIARHGFDPNRAVFFEDMARNLFPAKERGMATVHVRTDHAWSMQGAEDARIDARTDDLPGWLTAAVS